MYSLTNKNAGPEACSLYQYINSIRGKAILSGQQEFPGDHNHGEELAYIRQVSGHSPAILGLDYISNDFEGVNRRAEDWHNRGGIVTICWHCGSDFSHSWDECMKTEIADWDKALTEGTAEYKALIAGMDKGAEALSKLRDKGIPVLWRPFHELDGGWFWWSKGGAENFKKLWIMMYDRYTNYWGLDNLIWVWNGQDAEWYPGDEYVDIIGEDIYPGERVYQSQIASYLNAATNYSTENKMVYLTENGCLFDPELARRDGAMWGMWCTWSGEFVARDTSLFRLSEQYTEESMLKKVYEDEDVITLEDLPDLKTYKIRKGL